MVIIEKLKSIADAIRARTGGTEPLTLDEMAEAIESMEVADDDTNTYILVDENGNEIPAVLVDEPVMLTANATTDIRKGMTAVTDEGVVIGEKEIPAYHTTEGHRLIPNGSSLTIYVGDYDYTKFQAIICPFIGSIANSVSADKVVIDGLLYPVLSSSADSKLSIDHANKAIHFGVVNTSGTPCLIRYFSYKEIY
jgi:hypothetical protein